MRRKALNTALTSNIFITLFIDDIVSGGVKGKNKPAVVTSGNQKADQCIFLDADGKKCTIYEARPTQCRTYPYWPRLMDNYTEWESEAVVPDNIAGERKGHRLRYVLYELAVGRQGHFHNPFRTVA
jgi:Fe-S-cluster containining protein